ncbi:uncharacterized protein LOC131059750 isoform X2 [Cryptomeria japonica]|uniref:uncharacterized protein LOC131059750 isoform X2 n=1 Tax=Cryptomeria japonica TaxID=3369 RepID=UPI0027DA356A|nr:uncharacterized protein LOC131059750 isoform X2 [Cryptomeria japonica]
MQRGNNDGERILGSGDFSRSHRHSQTHFNGHDSPLETWRRIKGSRAGDEEGGRKGKRRIKVYSNFQTIQKLILLLEDCCVAGKKVFYGRGKIPEGRETQIRTKQQYKDNIIEATPTVPIIQLQTTGKGDHQQKHTCM